MTIFCRIPLSPHQKQIYTQLRQKRTVLPLVKALLFGIALKTAILNDETHSFIERSCYCWGLLSEENVDRGRYCVAQLGAFTYRALTALWVFTINQTICKQSKKMSFMVLENKMIMSRMKKQKEGNDSPLSLSFLSSQDCSNSMSHPDPYHPVSHKHSQAI